jgi:hypothetical protein
MFCVLYSTGQCCAGETREKLGLQKDLRAALAIVPMAVAPRPQRRAIAGVAPASTRQDQRAALKRWWHVGHLGSRKSGRARYRTWSSIWHAWSHGSTHRFGAVRCSSCPFAATTENKAPEAIALVVLALQLHSSVMCVVGAVEAATALLGCNYSNIATHQSIPPECVTCAWAYLTG